VPKIKAMAVEPAPASLNPGTLVRMAPLAPYTQFLFRRFRHDGGSDAGTLAPQQPFTGLLTALVGLPMCCVLGVARQNQSGSLTHVASLQDNDEPPLPASYGWQRVECVKITGT
jgi:hypothetical protein